MDIFIVRSIHTRLSLLIMPPMSIYKREPEIDESELAKRRARNEAQVLRKMQKEVEEGMQDPFSDSNHKSVMDIPDEPSVAEGSSDEDLGTSFTSLRDNPDVPFPTLN